MGDQPEELLDWQIEAAAIIGDVKDHVTSIEVSNVLKNTNQEIFLNLRTLENLDFCVRVSGNGFQICAQQFDKNDICKDVKYQEKFETPYALLNKISLGYVESFAKKLTSRLEGIEKDIR